MQLITLTMAEDGSEIKINPEYLVALSRQRAGTLATMEGKILALVKETPSEIAGKIGGVTL